MSSADASAEAVAAATRAIELDASLGEGTRGARFREFARLAVARPMRRSTGR
jgi:hypothetical protein